MQFKKNDTAQVTAQKVADYLEQGHSISLAHVFKHSIHHYCLREWLALANPELAQSIQLKTLPPPYMVEALDKHVIDGFCVGEPWNTQGELLGLSKMICSSQNIIPPVADKVLAVTQEWAEQHPQTLVALTTAIMKAQQELSELDDFAPILKIISRVWNCALPLFRRSTCRQILYDSGYCPSFSKRKCTSKSRRLLLAARANAKMG